jgi:glycosyltransferase involved in cell wall biosynthesis
MKENKLPLVSIATPTFNGERIIRKFLEKIFSQDYPLERLEVVLAEAGSTDKTVEIIKEFIKKYPENIRLIKNPKKYTEGKGFGNDLVTRATKGDIIVIIDQDNILVQKNWISNIVKILLENKEINAVQSRMFVPKNGTVLDKYLNAIGIEDPFILPYSLNAQIVLNPNKFKFNKEKGFFTYEVNLRNFLYAGANGFVIWRKDFFNAGGYVQDTENFYRFALKKYKIAIPKEVRLHHQTSVNLFPFLRKRVYFVMYYLLNNYNDRNFYWFSFKKNTFSQNLKFVLSCLSNILFLPGLFQGIKMALKEKKAFWLIHPFIPFFLTVSYIYAFFYVKLFNKIGMGYKH